MKWKDVLFLTCYAIFSEQLQYLYDICMKFISFIHSSVNLFTPHGLLPHYYWNPPLTLLILVMDFYSWRSFARVIIKTWSSLKLRRNRKHLNRKRLVYSLSHLNFSRWYSFLWQTGVSVALRPSLILFFLFLFDVAVTHQEDISIYFTRLKLTYIKRLT